MCLAIVHVNKTKKKRPVTSYSNKTFFSHFCMSTFLLEIKLYYKLFKFSTKCIFSGLITIRT